ncbi:hypothetical protein GWK47_016845 [Chionoecetes opilio]|uniref:THAP-type domain-containing protein n=1 Tax=Chionoecetes opilio TaxID=41210 RepID=A0A8J4XU55_CHIOP|nr:hypothetical protein GWK47_016845 [Chionoecetes opilio]
MATDAPTTRMPPIASRLCCILCGKKKRTHPGVKLHLFPKDARRQLQWLQTLKIAYVKNTQSICEEHFEPKYISSTGRLLNNAVPIPPGHLNPAPVLLDHVGIPHSTAMLIDCFDDFGVLPTPQYQPHPPTPSAPHPPTTSALQPPTTSAPQLPTTSPPQPLTTSVLQPPTTSAPQPPTTSALQPPTTSASHHITTTATASHHITPTATASHHITPTATANGWY